jgi:hypothetical protein
MPRIIFWTGCFAVSFVVGYCWKGKQIKELKNKKAELKKSNNFFNLLHKCAAVVERETTGATIH